MGSASKCFLSLILISLTLFLFNSPLSSISSSCNTNSVNVISNSHILSRFRSLLDLKNPNFFRRKAHNSIAFSPSPAPSEEIRKPFPTTMFHVNKTSHSPPLSHHQSFHNEKNGNKNTKKNSSTIVISICVSLAFMVIIFTIFSVLFWKKAKGKNKKVNFDPGPALFHLNSLAHCIDIHDTNLVKSSSSGALQNQRRVVSSPFLPSPLQNGDNTSCSEEESETHSFHSAQASDLSELPQNHLHSSLSPSNYSSYESVSRVSHISTKSIEVNDSHELHFPAISPPRISFLGHTMKSFPSKNSPISKTTIESGIPNDSLKFSFPENRSAGLSCNNASKSQGSSESQVLKDFPRNKKLVTFSKFAVETQDSSEYQVPNDSPEIYLPTISTPRTSFISNSRYSFSEINPPSKSKTNIPSKLCTSRSSVSTNINSPIIPISKKGNAPKPPLPPPPPPPPPPPMKKTSHQKPCNNWQFAMVPPSLTKNMAPVGKDGNTLPKLKPLHWDKVRAAPDRSMVWDQIRSSSFEFDEEMIESLFGYKSNCVLTHEEAKSKSPSPSKNLLDHKRLQNITILLKALNATPDQVCHALTKGSGLSVQQLEALVKMTPTKEEEENLSKYQGDIEELDPAEKFVKIVLSIPFAFVKIEVMLYKETFEDEVSHLRNSFAMLEEACEELKSSKLFLRLLEAVLKTGNRMNVGTTRGGAKSFKLDALLKLADVKGTDGKTTLLHFVIQEMNKPKPEGREDNKPNNELTGLDLVSGLSTELSNVKKTASVDLDVLIGSIENLSLGLSKLKQLIHHDLCVDDLNLRFIQSMMVFMQNAQRVTEELKNKEKEVLIHVREITEYYHGDLGKDETNPLRIFVIVREFLAMLDRVCKELRKPKINRTGPQLVILTR